MPKATKPPIQAAQITGIAGHEPTQAPAMIVATYLLIPRTTTIQAILAATPLLWGNKTPCFYTFCMSFLICSLDKNSSLSKSDFINLPFT